MRFIFILFISVVLFGFNPQSALAIDSIHIVSAGLDVGFGYRSDQLDWSISGDLDGENPNILSELSWDDLEILQVKTTGWLQLGKLPFLKRKSLVLVNIAFGKIMGGDVQDSDYATDDRNNEWSRSINDASQGLSVDLSGAVGPIFELNKIEGLSIIPLVGYGFNMQALTMTHGKQVISEPVIRTDYFGDDSDLPPDVGRISGLDSSYTTYWYGPWLGVNIDYQASKQFKMTAGVEYHWVEFFAQADWNLRSDFTHPVSFEHETTGTGIVWNVQGQYMLNEKWSWLLSGKIQKWETESGTDRIFLADGTVGLSRLNQVNWDSYALTMGMQYQF